MQSWREQAAADDAEGRQRAHKLANLAARARTNQRLTPSDWDELRRNCGTSQYHEILKQRLAVAARQRNEMVDYRTRLAANAAAARSMKQRRIR